MILFVFLGLLRTRSRLLLKHYVIVEPLAYWFKNMQQRGCRSLSGSLSVTLQTAWKKLNEMHTRYQATFNETLQPTPRSHAAFDNHNNIVVNKFPVEGKASNSQIGTAMIIKEDQLYYLPFGTLMRSPRGIPFIILTCIEHVTLT